MTSEEYIKNFLEKHYRVLLGDNDLEFLDITSNQTLSLASFVRKHYMTFFGDGLLPIYVDWSKGHENHLRAELNNFLEGFTLRLGRTGWVFAHDTLSENYEIPWSVALRFFQNKFPQNNTKLLERIFSEWYSNKVLETSEALMRY